MRPLPFAVAVLATLSLRAQQAPPPYDPLAGMDPDGRIQKPQLPPDLPNPDRWRYTPPGRIKPGNLFDRFLVSSFLTPIFFREEDVGFGGGLALTDIDFRNQDYQEFANVLLSYSAEGQQAYKIHWLRWLDHRHLDQGGIVRDERSVLIGRAGFEKTLTRRYYGRGSRSPKDAETSYAEEQSVLGFGVRKSVPDPGDDLLVRAEMRFERHQLGAGHVTAVPSTHQAYPGEFADGDELDQLWLDTAFAYDTRDSLHLPYRGFRVGIGAQTAVLQTGGEVGAVLGADVQKVFPLPPLLHRGGDGREENPPTDVLAFSAFVADTVGSLPYHQLPTLGGSYTLRGYIQNRFTDTSAAHAAVEYRLALIPRGFSVTDSIRVERIGLGVFYECGTVADGIDRLKDGRYLDSWGVGLRLGFAREAVFRVDLGFSDEQSNLILAFGNSF